MSAVNDLEGCTYMSQSLPFGGYKKSGYDRFAGPEGLRGMSTIMGLSIQTGENPDDCIDCWCGTYCVLLSWCVKYDCVIVLAYTSITLMNMT